MSQYQSLPCLGSSNGVGAIIGGAVGVLSMIIMVIIILAITAVCIRLHYSKGKSMSNSKLIITCHRFKHNTINTTCLFSGKSKSSVKIEAPVYDEPDNFRQNTIAKASDIELKDCPAYGKAQKDAHIGLELCPAYGELQSRS